jgi:hypothetical protein
VSIPTRADPAVIIVPQPIDVDGRVSTHSKTLFDKLYPMVDAIEIAVTQRVVSPVVT